MISLQNNNGGCVEYDDTATFLLSNDVSLYSSYNSENCVQ